MAKTVVILGGSYGGVHVAHYLLKQKIPDLKVIVVSKVSSTKREEGINMWLTPSIELSFLLEHGIRPGHRSRPIQQ